MTHRQLARIRLLHRIDEHAVRHVTDRTAPVVRIDDLLREIARCTPTYAHVAFVEEWLNSNTRERV